MRPVMTWAWLGSLAAAGLGTVLCLSLVGAARQEAERLRVARAELQQVRPRLRGARDRYAQSAVARGQQL